MKTRFVDAGYFASNWAGRTGLRREVAVAAFAVGAKFTHAASAPNGRYEEMSWSAAPELSDHRAVERVTSGESDSVEVSDHDPVRLPERRLGVWHIVGGAEFLDDFPGAAQLRAGHAGKKVMFDLVVQTAHQHGHPPATTDVSRRTHLLREEIELRVWGDHRHPFVVRRERSAHVDAEHRQHHASKRERHSERQEYEDGCKHEDRACGDHAELRPARLDRSTTEEELVTVEVQVQALEREKRKEKPTLLASDPPAQTASLGRVFVKERDCVDLNVGVFADHVRVRVMAAVLGIPPRETHTHERGKYTSETVVGWASVEDLTVARLVSEKRDLRKDDSEGCRDEQLEPTSTEENETCNCPAERERKRNAGSEVEAPATAKKAALTDHFGKPSVRARDRREVSLPGIRLTDGT